MVQVALSDLITYLGTALTSAGSLATINSSGNAVSVSGLTYPSADGTADQFLKTDGSGTLSFATPNHIFDASRDDVPICRFFSAQRLPVLSRTGRRYRGRPTPNYSPRLVRPMELVMVRRPLTCPTLEAE